MHDAAPATLRSSALVKADLGAGDAPIVNTTPRRLIVFLPRPPARASPIASRRSKGRRRKRRTTPKASRRRRCNGFLKKTERGARRRDRVGRRVHPRAPQDHRPRDRRDLFSSASRQIIESLRWPKMMRWGTGEHSYIRPDPLRSSRSSTARTCRSRSSASPRARRRSATARSRRGRSRSRRITTTSRSSSWRAWSSTPRAAAHVMAAAGARAREGGRRRAVRATRRSGRSGSTSPNIPASCARSSAASTSRCPRKCWSR